MYEIKKIQFTDQDFNSLVELMAAAFPKATVYNRDYLMWQYTHNPDGFAIGYNAFYNNSLVAHYVVQPSKMNIDGNVVESVLSFNTATHPEHQGKGLFTKLANATYEECISLGKKLVVGVANANSTPGFTKKLGFELYGPLEAKLTFGCGPKQKQTYFMSRDWNVESLRWRLSRPNSKYYSVLKENTSTYFAPSGQYGILAILGSFGESRFLDLSRPPKIRNPLNVWIGIEANYEASSEGFRIPKKLRPSPLNFIVKKLNSSLIVPKRDEILFQSIDFDAY